MPAPPRWLLAVPDAIRQLEALDRDLLTRRDVERLFGVSRARAAQLMRTFGAELVGASRVLRRTALLRQLRKYRQRAAFRGEEERRTRLVAELRQARLTGIRVAVPREARAARLAGLPEGIVRLTLRPAQCRDEHSPAPLPSASLSARNHQPCRLALPQILHELPGC